MSSKSLLPKVSSEFGSSEYWEKFFKKRQTAFEWYGNFLELCGVITRYIKKTDSILNVGCGNSGISANMYDFGFTNIVNVDYSETVIKQMSSKYSDRPEMKWETEDITKMSYQEDAFNVIFDKGTLDAIFSDNEESTVAKVEKVFAELGRVLKKGGRYILITLAQDYILAKIMQYFSQDWLIRIHKIDYEEVSEFTSARTPQYNPFAFVFTKFPNLPQPLIEMCNDDSVKPTRMNSIEEAIQAVRSHQHYKLLQFKINYDENMLEPPPIDMFTDDVAEFPRYRLYVINCKDADQDRKFGVFIIPHGREDEFTFASSQGRLEQVAASARFQRLVIVALNRNHKYQGGMQKIQDELSEKVMDFAPFELPKDYKAPFLSCGGGDLGQRNVRQQLTVNGVSYVIEDYVTDDATWCRRLVIDAPPDVANVLADYKLKKDRKKKKNAYVPNYSVAANLERLSEEESTSALLVGTNLALATPGDRKFRVLVLGLPENLQIITLLLLVYPSAELDVYEESESVIKLLKTWFYGLFHNYCDRFNIINQKYIGSKDVDQYYDVIIHDIGNSMTSSDESCITKVKQQLKDASNSMNKNGVTFIKVYGGLVENDRYSFLRDMFTTVHAVPCYHSACCVLHCNNSNDDDHAVEVIGNDVISNDVMTWKSKSTIDPTLSEEFDIEKMLENWKKLNL